MADVFISYKREDRSRVKVLVDALVADGLSVWWDVGIEGGAAWRRSIQEALENARCVIVVWSKLSAGPTGEFVHDEASSAKARGVYLPIMIDEVLPPLGFRQVQTLPFWGWNGRREDPGFMALLDAIHAMTATEAAPDRAPAAPRAGGRDPGRYDRPRVAVLAFRFPPGDQDQAFFAEGVAEDVIIGLSRSRLLRVMPGQSSLAFDTQGLTTERICAGLGVDYIVQGQVRPMGATLRVSAHLTHGRTEKSVWSDRYDRAAADLLAAQDEITTAIASTLEPALLAYEEQQAFRTPDEALGPWELFLRGRSYFWRGRRNDAGLARQCLERALALNPHDAPTLSLLADCALHDVWKGVEKNPRRAIAEAHRLALEAVGADGSDAFAHYTLGLVLSMMGRIDEAFAEQHHALELNPCLAAASGELARLLAFTGRVEESLAAADRAIGTSPNDPHIWLWHRAKALACFVDGRYAEATAQATSACVRRPDYYFLHELLAACAMATGDVERAHAALDEARRQMPHHSAEAVVALRATHPFTNPEHFERFLAALRAAGWDDGARRAQAIAGVAPEAPTDKRDG